ncbi:MAG: hypothetical protein EBT85_10005, partial [Synechococcaceae bacterium WB5_2B_268]|nr:hypothetical protein [Synechococcaceae bacterium WB5_2B_268]
MPYVANRERLSIYTEDGFQTSVKLPTSPTGNPSTIANATLEYLLPNSSTALPLTGNEILLNDRYGRTNTLRVKTSGSTSSNFVETKILLDRKDTQALVQLANEARRAKAYIYTNRDGVSVSKIAGQYDIININDTASRTYTAVNAIGTTVTNFGASGSGLVVTPGGYVTNPTIYNNVINYLIAEYGSLSETQRKYGFVQNSANKFMGKLGAKGFGMDGVSFGIAYLANEADAVAPDASNSMTQGWFGADTRFRLPVQLAWQSKDKKWLASANYAFERGNNSMGQVGTQLALTPFMYASLNESNQFGFTLAYQWSPDFSITGAYGHASVNARYDNSVMGVKMADAGDSAVMNSWMVALNFKNVFLKGNSAGFAIGGVPSLVSNSAGWNKDGGMPTALETWYQFQVTDNISITPGIFYISSTTNS